MREKRAKERERFEELKNQLYELVCMAEGSASVTKSELIRKYSNYGDDANMPEALLSQVKDPVSDGATLPIKKQYPEDTGSSGTGGELVKCSNTVKDFPVLGNFGDVWNDIDMEWDEFVHELLQML